MKYHFRVHPEKKGYFAECIELKGCLTQGDTYKELEHNMREVLALYLDEPMDSKFIFPMPRKNIKGRNIVKVEVEPRVAFSFYLRQLRLARKMTQKEVAEKLGIKNLYSYQRLENSKTANPELATIVQLKKIFPEMSLDDLLAA